MEKFPDSPDVYRNYALVPNHRRDWRESVARWNNTGPNFLKAQSGIRWVLGHCANRGN
jgi:hypothetical protein